MATRTRKAQALLFHDRLNILNKNVVETSPTKEVFRVVSAILALVRVGALDVFLWAVVEILTAQLGQNG